MSAPEQGSFLAECADVIHRFYRARDGGDDSFGRVGHFAPGEPDHAVAGGLQVAILAPVTLERATRDEWKA